MASGKKEQAAAETAAKAAILERANRKAIAFVPVILAGEHEAKQCAEQLTILIGTQEGLGWRFSHLESVTTVKRMGCFGFAYGFGNDVTRS